MPVRPAPQETDKWFYADELFHHVPVNYTFGHPFKSMNLAVASTHELQTTFLQQGNTDPGQSCVSRQTGHMLPSSFVAIMMKKK
jgi:hypothetical protein